MEKDEIGFCICLIFAAVLKSSGLFDYIFDSSTAFAMVLYSVCIPAEKKGEM